MTAELPPPIELRRPGTGRIILRALKYLRPYWAYTLGAYLVLLINNGITLAMPRIIGSIVDTGIKGGDLNTIRLGALSLVVLAGVRGLFIFLSGRWTEVASQNVAYDLRNAIHVKLQSLSFGYHDRAETGQLLSRAIGDVDRIRFLAGRAILRMVEIVTLVIGIAVSMLLLNVPLALLTLATVPFLGYGALRFGRIHRPMSTGIRQQMAKLTARLEQNLRGARVVKAFAQEDIEIGRFRRDNTRLLSLNLGSVQLHATYLPLLSFVASIGTIVILLYGGNLVISDRMTIGTLVAFTAYVGQLGVPVRRLGMIVAALAQSAASAELVFEILDAKSEVEDLPGAVPLEDVSGHVRFDHVSFAYFTRHKVLDDVDFEVEPGQVVALVGATGSGKSTVINLIPRFYDSTEGRILVDGHDIRHTTVRSLREQIGIVLQDTTLFASTIHENIAFGRPGASRDEVIAAARVACAHEFITELPQGYETVVGERGMTLSGGQRQRVAIARAVLKDPRILILDDATSSVDTETEALIQTALARLMESRTSFVIAQRLSTIRQADQVLVLDKGRVVAHGRRTDDHTAHQELLRTSGFYAEIYYRQLRPQELASSHEGDTEDD